MTKDFESHIEIDLTTIQCCTCGNIVGEGDYYAEICHVDGHTKACFYCSECGADSLGKTAARRRHQVLFDRDYVPIYERRPASPWSKPM